MTRRVVVTAGELRAALANVPDWAPVTTGDDEPVVVTIEKPGMTDTSVTLTGYYDKE